MTTEAATTLTRTDADHQAALAYERLFEVLDGLSADDWALPTECPGWSVRDMTAHMAGAAEGHASWRIMISQMLAGRRDRAAHDGNSLDAMNAAQIRSQQTRDNDALVAHLRDTAPAALRGRQRRARWFGALPVPIDQNGSTAGFPSSVSMGHLCSVVLTRDVWMHRFDIARAVGAAPIIDEQDQGLVADVAVEWQGLHGLPGRLVLTGPAGGEYTWGDGPTVALDALDFCRIVSGRRPEAEPPQDARLDTRVLF